MIRVVVMCCVGWLLWGPVAFAEDQAVSNERRWGIGLQGNLPLWGGLSVKYRASERLYLQAVEHYVQNGDEFSLMAGLQAPITLARYPWTRLYISPTVGIRKNREIQSFHLSQPVKPPDREVVFTQMERTVDEITYGGALLFGLEFFLDNIFASDNSRYGLNIEFGQGLGQVDRDAECKDSEGRIIKRADSLPYMFS